MGHRRGALTVDRGGGLLDLLLDLHLLLLGRGSSAAAPASTAAATTSAGHGRDNHLRDALGGEEVGEYDGEVGRDLGVARGLEEGVDLIGGDVGLLLCVCVRVVIIGSTKTNTMSEECFSTRIVRGTRERRGDEFQRSRTRMTTDDIYHHTAPQRDSLGGTRKTHPSVVKGQRR